MYQHPAKLLSICVHFNTNTSVRIGYTCCGMPCHGCFEMQGMSCMIIWWLYQCSQTKQWSIISLKLIEVSCILASSLQPMNLVCFWRTWWRLKIRSMHKPSSLDLHFAFLYSLAFSPSGLQLQPSLYSKISTMGMSWYNYWVVPLCQTNAVLQCQLLNISDRIKTCWKTKMNDVHACWSYM
jgi:hypothetical protein